MKLFELDSDARLTREMIKEFGDEYSIGERIRHKVYGIGNLRLINAHPSRIKFYDTRDHTIKTHFDWTKKGAVIRIRTMEKNYALGLLDSEITNIEMVKKADELFPFSLAAFLANQAMDYRILRWVPFFGGQIRWGAGRVSIKLASNEPIILELAGDLWKDALQTFGTPRMMSRLMMYAVDSFGSIENSSDTLAN